MNVGRLRTCGGRWSWWRAISDAEHNGRYSSRSPSADSRPRVRFWSAELRRQREDRRRPLGDDVLRAADGRGWVHRQDLWWARGLGLRDVSPLHVSRLHPDPPGIGPDREAAPGREPHARRLARRQPPRNCPTAGPYAARVLTFAILPAKNSGNRATADGPVSTVTCGRTISSLPPRSPAPRPAPRPPSSSGHHFSPARSTTRARTSIHLDAERGSPAVLLELLQVSPARAAADAPGRGTRRGAGTGGRAPAGVPPSRGQVHVVGVLPPVRL